jgi:hypothetical protein
VSSPYSFAMHLLLIVSACRWPMRASCLLQQCQPKCSCCVTAAVVRSVEEPLASAFPYRPCFFAVCVLVLCLVIVAWAGSTCPGSGGWLWWATAKKGSGLACLRTGVSSGLGL